MGFEHFLHGEISVSTLYLFTDIQGLNIFADIVESLQGLEEPNHYHLFGWWDDGEGLTTAPELINNSLELGHLKISVYNDPKVDNALLFGEFQYFEGLFLYANDAGLENLAKSIEALRETEAPSRKHLSSKMEYGGLINCEQDVSSGYQRLTDIIIYKCSESFVNEVRLEEKRRKSWQLKMRKES